MLPGGAPKGAEHSLGTGATLNSTIPSGEIDFSAVEPEESDAEYRNLTDMMSRQPRKSFW
jgi:hypothetical protein